MPVQCAVAVSQHTASHSARNCFSGVLRMELQLAFRETSLPLVVIGLLAFCQLLMPPPDAPYAVFTINSLKPLMSAGPMILATSAVFSAIAFPAYVLYLGGARARDLAAGVGPLYLSIPASTPSHAFSITLGRLVANILLALGSLSIVLPLLLVSIRIKTDEWPSLISIVAYFGIATPVVITAACSAVIFDFMIRGHALKTAFVFGLWMALLAISVPFHKFDFFGLRFIGENIFPNQPAASLAVGLIGGKIGTTPWSIVHETASHLLGRLQLIAGIAGMGMLAVFGMAATFRTRYAAASTPSSPSSPQARDPIARSLSASVARGRSLLPAQAVVRSIPTWQTVFFIAQRRLKHANWAKTLMIVAALVGLGTRQLSNAATIAFLGLIPLFGRHSSKSLEMERVLRVTTPGLWKPTPALLEAMALWGLIIIPVLPGAIWGGTSLLQCIHFLVGALAASAWLVLTHRVLARELLGVSVYLLIWYLGGCNRLPATLDVFGIHGTSAVSFVGALTMAGILCLAIARQDYRRS